MDEPPPSFKTPLFNSSRTIWFFGGFIALEYTFLLYALMCLSRHAFSVFSALYSDNRLSYWRFSPDELITYNWLFALIAASLGQAMLFAILFSGNRRRFGRNNRRRLRVINDQSFMALGALHWFMKMAMLYGIYAMVLGVAVSSLLHFDQDYVHYFFLIPVVIFLHSWMNVGVGSGKRWRAMLIAVLIVLVTATVLTRLTYFEFRQQNQLICQQTIGCRYPLDIPVIENPNVLCDINWLTYPLVITSDSNLINMAGEDLHPRDLSSKLEETIEYTSAMAVKPFIGIRCDRSTKMSRVIPILQTINKSDFAGTVYVVRPSETDWDKYYAVYTQKHCEPKSGTKPLVPSVTDKKVEFTVVLKPNQPLIVNGTSCSLSDLNAYLHKHFRPNTFISFKLLCSPEISYEEFVNVQAEISRALKNDQVLTSPDIKYYTSL